MKNSTVAGGGRYKRDIADADALSHNIYFLFPSRQGIAVLLLSLSLSFIFSQEERERQHSLGRRRRDVSLTFSLIKSFISRWSMTMLLRDQGHSKRRKRIEQRPLDIKGLT